MTWQMIIALAVVVLVIFLARVLHELTKTIKKVNHELDDRIDKILAKVENITRNVDEMGEQFKHQAARVDNITHEAQDTIDSIRRTVDLYNRAVARPAVIMASLTTGIRGAMGKLQKKK